MPKKFVIGTRGSLLAVTQCTLIKNLLEQRTGEQFELKTIKTQGDQVTDKPLWQLEGKDFFTKELDAALLSDEVDLVVHSYKDLGSDRPEGIKLGAITQRSFANDILLIKKETIARLPEITDLKVGTSSPRRIVNTEANLRHYLPGFTAEGSIECEVLRGNVNNRIQKLLDGKYHAIILAMAGLERLASYPDSRLVLQQLLQGLEFLVLPQRDFPSAASQGALAIEYHAHGPRAQEMEKILQSVHSPATAAEVVRERAAFQSYGGGCHLAVGIYVKKIHQLFVQVEKGSHDNKVIDRTFVEGIELDSLKGKKSYLVMGENDSLTQKRPLVVELEDDTNYFVTSKYCHHVLAGKANNIHLWSAGLQSAKQMVELGHWLNGVCDFTGHQELRELQNSEVVKLLNGSKWKVLSHDKSESPVGPVVGCYTRLYSQKINPKILESDVLYWGFFEQYHQYLLQEPQLANKIHACGLGKTFDAFQAAGIKVIPIVDLKEFKSITKVIS